MTIKKLFTNYQVSANEIILLWQIEVDKARSLGDNYIDSVTSAVTQREIDYRNKYGDEILSLTPVEELRKKAQESFEIQNRNIDWLKLFLSDNLSRSLVEPVYITYQGHSWYMDVFSRDLNFREKRELLEGIALPAQRFFQYPFLQYPESFEDIWLYQDVIFGYNGRFKELFSADEQKLLVLDMQDKERKRFEKLKNRFSGKETEDIKYERARIPEEVRIAVWRRDQGKCARCGGRENLEYDHIVPVSKGGGNTVRNIELLCQDCNRSKGSRIE